MTEKSRSMRRFNSYLSSRAGLSRRQRFGVATAATRALLHRVDDARFIGLELGLDFLFNRARPSEKRRLILVNGHADRGRLLHAALAVILLGQNRQRFELAAHR